MTTIYDPKHPQYTDEADVRSELTRVFDLCHGCRLCFKFCTSFPTLFEMIDHAQTLQIVLEAAIGFHAGIQGILPGMAEGCVAEIVRQRNSLGEVFIQIQLARDGARNLRDLQAVRQTGSEQIAFVVHEYLGLVFEPPKRGGVNDAVAITLKFTAALRGGLAMQAATGGRRLRGIGRDFKHGFPRAWRARRRARLRRTGC